jgi:hypothetical protein
MGVPAGSCDGTGEEPERMSKLRDNNGRMTAICPVCSGRLRLGVDGLLPFHAPAPAPAGLSAATAAERLPD